MLQSFIFSGPKPGPRFLVLGAVHGNEKCGPSALHRLIKEIQDGHLIIQAGTLTVIPVCNPKAYELNQREVDRNLNRFLVPVACPKLYEEYIGNILCSIIERQDVLLDIHSDHTQTPSYVFVGSPGTKEHEFADCLGAINAVTGWGEAYAASGGREAPRDPDEPIGTTEYARRFGAIAATIECGEHENPLAIETAYCAVKNALVYLKMTPDVSEAAARCVPTALIRVMKVIYRGERGRLSRDWKSFDPIAKGEIAAYDDNNNPIACPADDYVVLLPNPRAEPKKEWFYWARAPQLIANP